MYPNRRSSGMVADLHVACAESRERLWSRRARGGWALRAGARFMQCFALFRSELYFSSVPLSAGQSLT